jgi:arylsulfate sulfotransferase
MKIIKPLVFWGCSLAIISFLTDGCSKTSPQTNVTIPPPLTVLPVKVDSNLYTISGSGGIDAGNILLSLNTKDSGVLAIMDERGSILKEKKTPLRVDNFQKWIINGKTRYTYLQTEDDYLVSGVQGTEEGYVLVCDSNLDIVNRIALLPSQKIDTTLSSKVDIHEFILIGDNHYIAITYREKNPTNIPDSLQPAANVAVLACIIQEVDNGQVVFEWDGTDYPEFYAASVENNDFTSTTAVMDYMHMNSVTIDTNDQNLIVSFRNLNQIIKINRTTGAIMWRLGGNDSDFPLSSDQSFLRQHYVRQTDGGQTLLFVDNGSAGIRSKSRIMEMKLDESSKTVTSYKAYTVPDKFIQFAGSVSKENGSYFIGGGSAGYALQVNYTTNEVYLRINQLQTSYRALKY